MARRTTILCLIAAMAVFAHAPAEGATADDDEDVQPPAGPWGLSLATQVDQPSTRGFQGRIGYDFTKRTSAYFGADNTERTSTNPANFTSTGIEAGAAHAFARFGLDGAVAHWQNTDVNSATEMKLRSEFGAGPWLGAVRVGYRWGKFEPIDTTATPPGGPQPLPAIATCKLNNTAFGLDGRWQSGVWGAHATAMNFRYSDADCHFDFGGGTVVKQKLTRDQFAQLAAAQAAELIAAATHYIGREEMLLDGYVDAGASWKKDDFVVSLDYSRTKEYFEGATANTLSVTGTADLGGHTGVDCTLGITRGTGVSNVGYVGFALRAKF